MTTPTQTTCFAFSLEGIEPREELLFKSFIRLLRHRMDHCWLYKPQSSRKQVDLRVVSDKLLAVKAAVPTLTLSAISSTQPGVLCLPLRATEVETELNRLGAVIAAARNLAGSPDRKPNSAQDQGQAQAEGAKTFRLRRWPTATLVDSPHRVRMATLLTHQPLQLVELARRSGQPLAVCTAFVQDLLLAGLVIESVAATKPPATARAPKPPPSIVPRGLLARIRSRLGL
jgi:hypothetical protein